MHHLNRGLISLFLIFLTLGLIGFSFALIRSTIEERSRLPNTRGSQERTYAVSVNEFQPTNFFPRIISYGEVGSWKSLELRSPVGGRIEFVSDKFKDGALITKGELIYKIDPIEVQTNLDMARIGLDELSVEKESSQANLNLAESDLDSAKKQLQLRLDNFNRQLELSKSDIVTRSAVETAELNLVIAKQTVLAGESALFQAITRKKLLDIAYKKQILAVEKALRELNDTQFYAPFDAIISRASAIRGRLVNSGEQLGILIDPLAFEVSFQLSNGDFNKIIDENLELVGLPIVVSLEFENREVMINGQINRMASEVLEGASGKRIFASLNTSSKTILRPGDFVKVVIKERELESVFVVPAVSVNPDNRVLVLNDSNRLEELAVEVMRRQGDEVVLRSAPQGVEYVVRRTPQLGIDLKIEPIRKIDLENALDSQGKIKEIKEELVALNDEKRQFYIERITENKWMPESAKNRIIKQLEKEKVSKKLIERMEKRMQGN